MLGILSTNKISYEFIIISKHLNPKTIFVFREKKEQKNIHHFLHKKSLISNGANKDASEASIRVSFFLSVARKKAKRNEYIKFAFCKNGDHLCYTKVPLDLYFCKNGDQIIQKLPPKK